MNRNSQYTYVQFIGFEHGVDTFDEDVLLSHDKDYSHLLSKLSDLKELILAILQSDKLDESISVLKVLILPEFFFRPMSGFYNLGTNLPGIIRQHIETICNETNIDICKDILFIAGTVVSGLYSSVDPEEKPMIFDYSVICTEEIFLKSVHKKYIVPGDFPYLSSESVTECYPEMDNFVNERNDRGGIITYRGITFGVEICGDHGAKDVPGRLLQWHQTENTNIFFHVIVGASVAIVHNNTISNIVFICNGGPEEHEIEVNLYINKTLVDPIDEVQFRNESIYIYERISFE